MTTSTIATTSTACPAGRRIAAVALPLGALLFTVGDLLRRATEPSGSASASATTRAVGDHGATWLAAGLLSVAAAFCLVLGVNALLADAGGRGGRTTKVGAVMVAVGAMASVGHAVAFYAPYALYARAGTPGSQLTALDDASESYPLLVALIGLFVLGMMVGTIVLFAGLRRARRVPIWSLVAAVVFVVCGSVGGVGPGVLAVAAALIAFVPAAHSLVVPAPRSRLAVSADGPLPS